MVGDPSYRLIPRAAGTADVRLYHLHIDTSFGERDLNCALPLDRLAELEREAVIGRSAETHYSFIGYLLRPREFLETSLPPMIERMRSEHVDVVRGERSPGVYCRQPGWRLTRCTLTVHGPSRRLLPHMSDAFGKAVASSAAPMRTPRALVVEYDRWLRTTIAALVEEVGYAVTTASNGYSGLRLALDIRPSLVVLGRGLPELSAEELRAALRHAMAGSGTLIIDDRTLLCDEPEVVAPRSAWPLHVQKLALRHTRADCAAPISNCATRRHSGVESAGRTSRRCGQHEAGTRGNRTPAVT